ncbi:Zinc finger MYM-type protein [Trichinella pseudospiralis]
MEKNFWFNLLLCMDCLAIWKCHSWLEEAVLLSTMNQAEEHHAKVEVEKHMYLWHMDVISRQGAGLDTAHSRSEIRHTNGRQCIALLDQ